MAEARVQRRLAAILAVGNRCHERLENISKEVRVVPFDYGLDRGTGGHFKPLGA
jgi:hypothetical protein